MPSSASSVHPTDRSVSRETSTSLPTPSTDVARSSSRVAAASSRLSPAYRCPSVSDASVSDASPETVAGGESGEDASLESALAAVAGLIGSSLAAAAADTAASDFQLTDPRDSTWLAPGSVAAPASRGATGSVSGPAAGAAPRAESGSASPAESGWARRPAPDTASGSEPSARSADVSVGPAADDSFEVFTLSDVPPRGSVRAELTSGPPGWIQRDPASPCTPGFGTTPPCGISTAADASMARICPESGASVGAGSTTPGLSADPTGPLAPAGPASAPSSMSATPAAATCPSAARAESPATSI
ncbi:hypothetical protein SAMN04489717_1101 [Actinopolymorpha singaporensis]|uniref:Uncharacterized protein n=1 Tax=Actinopolymorpha singaporensis TaxID=117157 RepID=A0A1H1N5Q4_9ACTN|nr:hypothetical protein SAMN04489717_1101 [Actinopolymorpha singaporensis]